MAEFHIHVDAIEIEDSFEAFLNMLNFSRSDFCGHREGLAHFEPPNHFTFKCQDGKTFRNIYDQLFQYCRTHTPLKGYLEAEFVPIDLDLPEKPYNHFPIPFVAELEPLNSGFRESEIHITLDSKRSEPQLLSQLLEMGFFSAFIQKQYGVAEVFTLQGTKRQISDILPIVKSWLIKSGGAKNCSLKEERIIEWWVSHDSLDLPPIIKSIAEVAIS